MAEEYRRPARSSAPNRRKSFQKKRRIFSFKIFRQLTVSVLLLATVFALKGVPTANSLLTKAFNYTMDTKEISEALGKILQKNNHFQNTKEGLTDETAKTETTP